MWKNLPGYIRNLKVVLISPHWRLALGIAMISDFLSFGFIWAIPIEWLIEVITVIIFLVILGFKWPLFIALVIETIPAIQIFPSWTLAILALAGMEDVKKDEAVRK